ncbi:hypothetical protein AB0758_43565 [Tolypothrix bouteillei VB521301_2]
MTKTFPGGAWERGGKGENIPKWRWRDGNEGIKVSALVSFSLNRVELGMGYLQTVIRIIN